MTSGLDAETEAVIKAEVDEAKLGRFIVESNEIEGVDHIRGGELRAYQRFMSRPEIKVADMLELAGIIAKGRLRAEPGMDVKIVRNGEVLHKPPPGGPSIPGILEDHLRAVNDGRISAYRAHLLFETLHPFTDGNGRTGRALYMWHKDRHEGGAPWGLGFLHHWYYESLQHWRGRR